MKQDAAAFRSTIEAEFDKQKAHLDEAFKAYSARLESAPELDAAFSGMVAEHLSLAKDEGAQIAANAMVEAEKLDHVAVPSANFDELRDAINEISHQESQSSILKSLVEQAARFAPRGAFFIIKNEHFVGWKVFGASEDAENVVKEMHFPITQESILGSAVHNKATADNAAGTHTADHSFLEPLQFGNPDRMYAIPLVARDKAVAVLYTDHGADGSPLNREALESLVRVAGLTVELQATAKAVRKGGHAAAETDAQDAPDQYADAPPQHSEPVTEAAPLWQEPQADAAETAVDPEPASSVGHDWNAVETAVDPEPASSVGHDWNAAETVPQNDFGMAPEYDSYPAEIQEVNEEPHIEEERSASPFESEFSPSFSVPEPESAESVEPAAFGTDSRDEMQHEANEVPEVSFETQPADAGVSEAAIVFDPEGAFHESDSGSSQSTAPAFEDPGTEVGAFETAAEPVAEASFSAAPKPRLNDRPVDLPIEVPESERRIHNDARRFARLLVSEIKLYNEKKVIEGREASDLYERLREAVDRSREMYDKRVQPPVAATFDYFHYELVNSLADGDVERLGSSYPGASV